LTFWVFEQHVYFNDQGVMEERGGSDVPGATGEGACAETGPVIGEMRNDQFDDLPREPGR
jgi:hypothetical protein